MALDLESGEQVAALDIGEYVGPLAADSESVWVARSGGLSRVDPHLAEVTATVEPGDWPARPLLVDGDVWVANRGSGSVTRIDAVTAEVTATVELGAGPCSITLAGTAIWVANGAGGTVARIPLPLRSP